MEKKILTHGTKIKQYYLSISKNLIDSGILTENQKMNIFTDDQIETRNSLIIELINGFYKKKIARKNKKKIFQLILELNISKIPDGIDLGNYEQVFDDEGYLINFEKKKEKEVKI
jgi:hypothetical protein